MLSHYNVLNLKITDFLNKNSPLKKQIKGF